MLFNLCAPAFIYVIFSLAHIIIDTFKGNYNTALLKFIISILFTFMLDSLCKVGLNVISWIIVFIPFIFMTLIVSILLYVFGLDIATGQDKSNIFPININPLNKTVNNSNTFFSSDTQYTS